MQWRKTGTAWVFGDNISNDDGIMSLKFVREQEYRPEVLAHHIFEQIDPTLPSKIKVGDFIVAGRNFGFGNPHVQGFLGLKGAGVSIIAESVLRGPLRTCINAGVPILSPVSGIRGLVESGDELEVDFIEGLIINLTTQKELKTDPIPEIMREIVEAGSGMDFMFRRAGIVNT
ncbi:3-isopropylmalate dehydratase [Sneathiella chungangensis]|uniref:3-isopropylmalate dehydratase n=1 Tax=Sneathiella chungangensis TaxID=1418234 RepID=A0A845MN23_9PROT|nr:3-isopropylmalate dehydratase [Sneathiella chungangensis]MZR23884.1 3-isopropylmalate dehydratase [Sneathiella chungangensis]